MIIIAPSEMSVTINSEFIQTKSIGNFSSTGYQANVFDLTETYFKSRHLAFSNERRTAVRATTARTTNRRLPYLADLTDASKVTIDSMVYLIGNEAARLIVNKVCKNTQKMGFQWNLDNSKPVSFFLDFTLLFSHFHSVNWN